jgi:hypothetical protein
MQRGPLGQGPGTRVQTSQGTHLHARQALIRCQRALAWRPAIKGMRWCMVTNNMPGSSWCGGRPAVHAVRQGGPVCEGQWHVGRFPGKGSGELLKRAGVHISRRCGCCPPGFQSEQRRRLQSCRAGCGCIKPGAASSVRVNAEQGKTTGQLGSVRPIAQRGNGVENVESKRDRMARRQPGQHAVGAGSSAGAVASEGRWGCTGLLARHARRAKVRGPLLGQLPAPLCGAWVPSRRAGSCRAPSAARGHRAGCAGGRSSRLAARGRGVGEPALQDLALEPRQRELHVLAGTGFEKEAVLFMQLLETDPVLRQRERGKG